MARLSLPLSLPSTWPSWPDGQSVSVQQLHHCASLQGCSASSANAHFWTACGEPFEGLLGSPVGNSTSPTGDLGSLSQGYGLPWF